MTIVSEVAIPGRLAKAVASFCSTDPKRALLQSALIRKGHLIATNGHVLMKTPLFDHPYAPRMGDDMVPEYLDHPDWALPAGVLKDMKVSEHLSVTLKTGEVVKVKTDDSAVTATLPKLEEPESPYPDIEQVLPSKAPVARVGLDPDYLIRVAKLAQAFGWETIVFDLTDGEVTAGRETDHAKRAVVLRCALPGPHTTTGLLMPKALLT